MFKNVICNTIIPYNVLDHVIIVTHSIVPNQIRTHFSIPIMIPMISPWSWGICFNECAIHSLESHTYIGNLHQSQRVVAPWYRAVFLFIMGLNPWLQGGELTQHTFHTCA